MKTVSNCPDDRFMVDEQAAGASSPFDDELLNNYIRIRGVTFAPRFDASITGIDVAPRAPCTVEEKRTTGEDG